MKNKIQIIAIVSLTFYLAFMAFVAGHWKRKYTASELLLKNECMISAGWRLLALVAGRGWVANSMHGTNVIWHFTGHSDKTKKPWLTNESILHDVWINTNSVMFGTGGARIESGSRVDYGGIEIDAASLAMASTNDVFRLGKEISTLDGLCIIKDGKQTNQYWFSKPTLWTNLWDITNGVWIPIKGDHIQTSYLPGPPTIHTVTNVARVGEKHCQTGWMVYCEGLPGLDAWWVKRVP